MSWKPPPPPGRKIRMKARDEGVEISYNSPFFLAGAFSRPFIVLFVGVEIYLLGSAISGWESVLALLAGILLGAGLLVAAWRRKRLFLKPGILIFEIVWPFFGVSRRGEFDRADIETIQLQRENFFTHRPVLQTRHGWIHLSGRTGTKGAKWLRDVIAARYL